MRAVVRSPGLYIRSTQVHSGYLDLGRLSALLLTVLQLVVAVCFVSF
jgi:hypothetical protein